jgi:diguanylate cyclase (GGDEF)-like protein
MDFHIPTAMQLTATMTMIIGVALALTVRGYPLALQEPMRLWVRGLLIQPFSYALLSMRGQAPDWLSIVVANTLLAISFAHLVQALRLYNDQADLRAPMIALIATTAIGESLLTWVWPSLHGRIILISAIIMVLSALGVEALYRRRDKVTRPEHMVATMLIAGIAILLVRIFRMPDMGMLSLTESTPMQGIVFTYASLMPVIATSGFLLMCGERLNENLTRLAMVDPLTGVLNRRTMTELASQAIDSSRRHGAALSLLILDIDHFKRINDQFGHEAGDLGLCRFVELVRQRMGKDDMIARLGGEEFVLILPGSDEQAALNLAERIRQHLSASHFSISGWPVPLRASIGVGTLGPEISNLETLLRETDRAMYAAKHAGRNCVVAASRLGTEDAPSSIWMSLPEVDDSSNLSPETMDHR